MEVYNNQDPKLNLIFSDKDNLEDIKNDIKSGFLSGRSIYRLITSVMESNAPLKFNKEQGSFFIGDTLIPLDTSVNFIPFWIRGIVHEFKLKYNTEYKEKFEQTAQSLAKAFIDAQKPDKIKAIQRRKEELDQNIRLLKEGIETLKNTKLPEKSIKITDLETKIKGSGSKIQTLETTHDTLQHLKDLLANEDVFDKGMTAIKGFFRQQDIHVSTDHQNAKQNMIDELESQGILITKEQLDDHNKINTTYIEHEIAAEKEALEVNQKVLNSLQEEYNKTRDENNEEIDNTIIELRNKVQILQGELKKVLGDLQQLGVEDTEQAQEKADETISPQEIEKTEKAISLKDNVEFVDVEPEATTELATLLTHLNARERAFYATLTSKEQAMYAAIATIEGENFSVVADLILAFTRENNPSHTYDSDSKILTVTTPKQRNGTGLVSVTIPTQLKFQYNPAQKQWKILKGPEISGITLKSIEYNNKEQIKLNADYSWVVGKLVPENLKDFIESGKLINMIFKIPEKIAFT